MAKKETPGRKRAFHASNVVVIGLGRFGTSLALELVKNGHQVFGIDTDDRIVQSMASSLTHVVTADTTDEDAVRELGLGDMDSAVVAIGADIEASILTTSLLLQLGVKQVWAKANSKSHGRILEQIGAHHVVFPEYEMGRRVAHQVTGESLDYVPIDEDFVMLKGKVPNSFDGKNLGELKIRSNYGVTVVAVKAGDGKYTPAFPETVLLKGQTFVVAGEVDPLYKFCQLD
jgi:trk system potassium uptake protein TrkA